MILIPDARSFFALPLECKLLVLVWYSCSEAMAKVSLQSTSGAHVELSVQNLEASLHEEMQDICSSFNKPCPRNWAVLTSKKGIFEQPDSQPFLRAQDGDIYMVVFEENDVLELQFMSKEHKKILMVRQNMSLRDVQHLLCRALQERFPLMCENLKATDLYFLTSVIALPSASQILSIPCVI